MAASKKPRFPALPILNIFSWNFHGLVLGLVELIDAKGIGVAQLIWLWGCPTKAQKQPKDTKNALLSVFKLSTSDSLSTIFQPHQCPWHQSILLTQGPNHKILAEIAQLLVMLKNSVFWVGHFDFFFFFFFPKKNCFIPMKINHKLCDRMDGT